ncbi:MAG: 16S rRNA (cytosine(1402)-N(4))-methyltransferase RsmH [Legionellaceae bacterium]|nr:16S rRNA (cytosine(1402)-N(4))-methyltransferase RsmH [Legionellaceae bacterium]
MKSHQSVMLDAAVNALAIKVDGTYIDGTFGRGGHSAAILECLGPGGRLLAVDKDIAAIQWAKTHFSHEPRLQVHHASFSEIKQLVQEQQLLGQIDGILLDLGVSSPQLDEAERGFSFMQDGPLDMRMDQSKGESAAEFVNHARVETMAAVFRDYGEERYAKRIATAIEKARQSKAITRTLELAEIVKAAHPRWEKHKHPATRVFQAIRIHVNGELTDLENVLQDALEVLAVGGRLSVISFHSLEDRIVKQFMRHAERGPQLPRRLPVTHQSMPVRFKRLHKAVKPSEDEISKNIRARSAVLRVGEKLL